jgi:hypothetical protein
MGEQPGISFSITSFADTRGLIDATTGINAMGDAERRREEARKGFLSAAEREVAEVNRLAESSSKAAQAASKLTKEEVEAAQKMGEATKQYNDAALAKLKSGQAARSAGLDMSKMGMLGNQASYQIGDFVTQVQMGTSAARAFSQQAPQLIGTFTSLGLVSGGLGLALGGVAVAIPLVTMLFERFSGSADVLKPKIDAINAASEKNSEILTKAYEAHLKDMAAADAAVQKWDELKASRNAAALASLSNAQKELEAFEALNEALGIQVDLIGAKADIERTIREETARQKAEAEAGKSAGAVNAVGHTMDRIADAQSVVARLRAEADKKDKESAFLLKLVQQAEADGYSSDAATLDRAKTIADANAIRAAVRDLEAKISDLEDKANSEVAIANDKIASAGKAIRSIGETLSKDNAVGMATEIRQRAKQQADDLKGILAGITPLNDSQQAAFDTLQRIAADGKVTADESASMASNLEALMDGVRVGLSSYNGTMKMLVALTSQMVSNDQEYRTIVLSLKGQVGDLSKELADIKRNPPK